MSERQALCKYLDRDLAIFEIARSKRVLHLGCVGHTDFTQEERVQFAKNTLHWKLSSIADVVGVDHSQQVIGEYERLGVFQNIVYGDVEHLEGMEVDEKFDVIVAADIIEHLSSPGAMLNGMKRFCRPDTQIIITTPHAFGLLNYLRFLFGRFQEGDEHVMTFNLSNLISLLNRHGYHIDRLATCHQAHAKTKGILFKIGKIGFSFIPKLGGTLFVAAHVAPPDSR